MPLFVRECRAHVVVDQFLRQCYSDDSRSQHQHVHVVVLDTLVCRIGVVTQAGAHSGNFVCGYGSSYSAAADQDGAIHGAVEDALAHCLGVIGIVDWIGAVGAKIDDFVTLFAQVCRDLLLQRKSGMVGADADLHALLATLLASISLATLMIASGVKPNFFCSSLSGAEAPKVFIPMRAAGLRTYCAHPYVEACSTEMRFCTAAGRTLSL